MIRCPAHRTKPGREARLGEHKATDGKTRRLAGVGDRLSKYECGGNRPTEKVRNDAIARVKLASARGVVDGLRPVRLTDPNTGEAIPTSLVADDKGPFGFEHGTAPAPAASHPRQNSDHKPRTAPRERPFQRLKHKRLSRKQGRKALDAVNRPTQAQPRSTPSAHTKALAQNRCAKIRCGLTSFGVCGPVRVWPCGTVALCGPRAVGFTVAGVSVWRVFAVAVRVWGSLWPVCAWSCADALCLHV